MNEITRPLADEDLVSAPFFLRGGAAWNGRHSKITRSGCDFRNPANSL
ncbi:hypothetical protein [Novosphingobium panipatense]